MSRGQQLVKNTGILALGKICTQFISFFLLPLYTAYLTTEQYGIVDLLQNYVSLLIPIFFFQMDQGIFRFLIDVRKNETKKEELISTALITITKQAILFIIIYGIACLFINNNYKYFLMINVIISMYSGNFLQICRGLGDNLSYSLGSLITGITTVLLNIIFIVVFKLGAYGMLSATLIANFICILFIFIRKKIYKYIKLKKYSKEKRKEIWKYTIPLIPNQLSWWVVNVSDRTIITYFINIAANGIYSAANKFSTICTTFFNFFNMTWSESASMHIKDGDSSEFFSKIFNISIGLFSSLCIGIIAVMPFCFKFIITGAGFAEAYYQIPILLTATIFNIVVSLIGSIYVALKKSNEIAKTSILAAIINIIINIIFIKKIGLFAASISTLAAYLSMSIYRYKDVQKYVKISIDKKNILILIITLLFISIIYYIRNNYLCIIGVIITICSTIIINRDLISKSKSIINKIKRKLKK